MGHFKDLELKYLARTYEPLDVVFSRGYGCWLEDKSGNKYLNLHSGYSALNWGAGNERFISALVEQATRLPLTSRSVYNDILPEFAQEICTFFNYDKMVPMCSGAEAVETAIKAVRRWGYEVKGVEEDCAEIIVFENNFAGRTISIVSFYEPQGVTEAKKNFGPYTPGFKFAKFNDLTSVQALITKNTVGILAEVIQAEGGILIGQTEFLRGLREICNRENICLIFDEVQTGLHRAGPLLACMRAGVKPDVVCLGKSLGGGLVPVSVVLGRKDILDCFRPGSHGSTFGGYPIACRVALEVIRYIRENDFTDRVIKVGEQIKSRAAAFDLPVIKDIRGMGLMIGIELTKGTSARAAAQKLLGFQLLVGECRKSSNTIRIQPPLIIADSELEFLFKQLKKGLESIC